MYNMLMTAADHILKKYCIMENSVLIAIRNIYIWAHDMAPPAHVVTWTYMNTHELH